MKKSSEYLGKEEFLSRGTIEKLIEQAQIDAYNQALEDAAENVTLLENGKDLKTWGIQIEKYDTFYIETDIEVSKQSILKLKK